MGKALTEAGLVPSNCKLMEIRTDVTGSMVIRYEVMVTSGDLAKIADVYRHVAKQIDEPQTKPTVVP